MLIAFFAELQTNKLNNYFEKSRFKIDLNAEFNEFSSESAY